MYTVRITHHPATGKAQQLRQVVEERVKAANAAGVPHSLAQQMYAPPTLVTSIRHDSLAALEAYGERNAGDPAYRAAVAKITECIDGPLSSELYQVIVPAQPTGSVNYSLRIRYFSVPGKNGELRQALEERANLPRAGAVGVGLTSQVAPSEGFNFVVNVLFSSLGGLGEFADANRMDPSLLSFQAQTASLLARPVTQDLYRILMPFPAR